MDMINFVQQLKGALVFLSGPVRLLFVCSVLSGCLFDTEKVSLIHSGVSGELLPGHEAIESLYVLAEKPENWKLSLEESPPGTRYHANRITYFPPEGQGGSRVVRASAINAAGQRVTSEWYVKIHPTFNAMHSISRLSKKTWIPVGKPFKEAFLIQDAEADSLLELLQIPKGAVFRDSNLEWTPDSNQVGSHRVSIGMKDRWDRVSEVQYEIEVKEIVESGWLNELDSVKVEFPAALFGYGNSTIHLGSDELPLVFAHGINRFGPSNLLGYKCANESCSTGTGLNFGRSHSYDLDIGSDGLPLIVHSAAGLTATTLQAVKCIDADCIGKKETMLVDSVAGAINPKLDFGTGGKPVIAYWTSRSGRIDLVHCGSGDCTTGNRTMVTPPWFPKESRNFDLRIDGEGRPLVIAMNPEGGLSFLKCGNPDCTHADSSTQISPGRHIVGFSAALGSNGLPILAINASGILQLLTCLDPLCRGAALTDSLEEGSAVQKLLISQDGSPILSFSKDHTFFSHQRGSYFLDCKSKDCQEPNRPVKISNHDGIESMALGNLGRLMFSVGNLLILLK